MGEEVSSSKRLWTAREAYITAVLCFLLGLPMGYFFKGTGARFVAGDRQPASAVSQSAAPPEHQMPSMEQMKAMADKAAEPLLARLAKDPNNVDLINQVGIVYLNTHQFPEAKSYFEKALQLDPKNVNARANLAEQRYYTGDVDGAIDMLNSTLQYAPSEPRILFNLGMLRWKEKGDSRGAVQLWRKLLDKNPKLPSDKKQQVEEMIRQASST